MTDVTGQPTQHGFHQRRGVPRVVSGFWTGSAVVFALMFAVGYVRRRAGLPRAHYNPLGTIHYTDLLEYLPTYRLLHTAAFFHNPQTNPVAYPPFGAIFYQLLYSTGHPVGAYIALSVVWLAVLTVVAGGWLRRHGMPTMPAYLFPCTVVLTAFPFLGMVRYGNIELFLWVFATAGICAFLRGRPYAAALLWGCAAAMKLYPVIFLALLLAERRFRAVVLGVVAFAVVTLLSLLYLGPTVAIAWQGSLRNVFGYQGKRVEEWSLHELATNHSAFTWVKFVLRVAGHPFAAATLPWFVCGALVFCAVFFLRSTQLPFVNRLLTLTTFMLLFPPISYFHTLVHMFVPLALLMALAIRAEQQGLHVPRLHATLALFLPLFASFMVLTERSMFLFGGMVQACFLAAIFFNAARYPFSLDEAAAGEAEPLWREALSLVPQNDDECAAVVA